MKKASNIMAKLTIVLLIGDVVLVLVNAYMEQYIVASMFLIAAINMWIQFVTCYKENKEKITDEEMVE